MPAASDASRPAVAALMRCVAPDALTPRAAWPCPETMIDGIQEKRGFETAESKRVPACWSTGVPPVTSISYQREPSRSPVAEPTPPESTAMLCAVQIRLPRRFALKSRSSMASSRPSGPPALPWWGTGIGIAVTGTARDRFAEMPVGGQAFGALNVMRRNIRVPKLALSTPTIQASVAVAAARLSTPCGE